MSWQDWVLSIGGWIFVIALIPTIRDKQKPEFSTSIINTVVLAVFVFCYITLGLYMTAVAIGGTATGWAILAYQRWKQPKSPKP